nr:retrovirus-related Pol polyprotein from transposon TNT 1-94 [Tanacetum cinerariifolium]
MKIEESLNMTFDETPPPSKTSPLVDDDLDEEEAIKKLRNEAVTEESWIIVMQEELIISLQMMFGSYSQNSKAHIILNRHTMKIEKSLNVTFDETPPPSKTLSLVDDDLDEEEAIKVTKKKNLENDIEDETLEIDKIVNVKESRNHPLENVIGKLNQITLRINHFVANDVWELVPQPKNMPIIGTKWVFRNKLDENGVVSLNKSRLVAQDYNQQEGIDYDETYTPGSLLYLTASRPDIMFSVCFCARFQEAPKTSHLEVVKRIFRYIKGTTHLGLWYPKRTGIEIVVYADSDHAGDYVVRKSTSEFGHILRIPFKGHCSYSDKWSLDYLEISTPTKGHYQTIPHSPSVIKTLIQTPQQGQITRVRNKKTVTVDENKILNHEILNHMSSWVEIIRENVLCLRGHHDHVPTCFCHMLYYIETSTKYNLAFFILKRMESIRNAPKANLAYEMLLTRLFTHVVSNFHELSNDRYILCDRVMHPLAPYYERKTRSDHGTKRCRSSNPSSSSIVLDHPSSSHHIDKNDDGSDEEFFHSNTPSPS